ncbi:MAG TPA: MFS transporter, partial [Gammaproteobacteria bacterium]|nr:MFS transporter [Gammaproteobacteria bacterium]
MMQKRIGNWYFGWNIVAAATLITLLTVGMRMGIGPFFIPIAESLALSRTLLATIVAVGMLAYGVGMPIAGHLAQTYGSRFVLILGTVLVVIASIWTVRASHPFSFFLAFGVLLSLGFSFTSPVALTPMISRWFTRRRGMALFFLSTGSMAGIAIMTPLLTFAIERLGWRDTILWFAVIFVLLVVPAALLIIRD